MFVYHDSNEPGGSVLCDFGVEVTRTITRTIKSTGEVYATETPGARLLRRPTAGRATAWTRPTTQKVRRRTDESSSGRPDIAGRRTLTGDLG